MCVADDTGGGAQWSMVLLYFLVGLNEMDRSVSGRNWLVCAAFNSNLQPIFRILRQL